MDKQLEKINFRGNFLTPILIICIAEQFKPMPIWIWIFGIITCLSLEWKRTKKR